MSTVGLVKFFMAKRRCSFAKATYLAEQVVLKRKLQTEKRTDQLQKAQLTFGLDEMPAEEATSKFEPEEPLPF